MVRIRVVCRLDEVEIALARLRQGFSAVTADEPRALESAPGFVRIHCRCQF